jgi:hypothetical protein
MAPLLSVAAAAFLMMMMMMDDDGLLTDLASPLDVVGGVAIDIDIGRQQLPRPPEWQQFGHERSC